MIVPSEGSKQANICLIGEAPGEREWKEGRPFIGPSGNLLFALLKKFGISRSDCYLTNVIKDSPLVNPLERLAKVDKKTGQLMPSQKLIDYRQDLIREIESTSCHVYVPMGNTALWAIVGQTGISLWRNSVLTSPIGNRKVIPTYHPAALLRQTSLYDLSLIDFRRIAEESLTNEITTPNRRLITKPTAENALEILHRFRAEKKPFAFDVETPGGIVDCVSFSNDSSWAISIPFISKYWSSASEFVEIWKAIRELLEDPNIIKIGHNVSYDILAMSTTGIHVKLPYQDTMHKHHCLDPIAEAHSLAFLCSIFTREPYYKEWDTAPSATIVNLETYNALDSAATIEANTVMDKQLGKRSSFYTKHYQNLLPHLIDMYEYGLLIDQQKRQALANDIKKEVFQLEKLVAEKLNLKSFNANSPKQCAEVVYGILGCKPKYKRRGKKTDIRTLSTDEDTLLRLFQEEPIDVLMNIRKCREQRKLLSFLDPSTKNAKARRSGDIVRTEYKPMTKTGRLSSSASVATRIGLNLQNQPKSVREMFIPRPGHIFLARDLPQAEAQVTAADAENLNLLHFFEMSKAERGKAKAEKQFDIHIHNASLSLDKDKKLITKMEREACKRVVHGTNYGMKAFKQQEVLLKELTNPDGTPYWLPLNEVELRRNRYLASDPSIEARQERIRVELLQTRKMFNPFGRMIIFHEIINDPDVLFYFGQRNYDDAFQSAYSWFPQSTIADMINQSLIAVNEELKRENLGRVVAQIHDELLMEIKDDLDSLKKAVEISNKHMSKPVRIRGYELQIFPDIKLGYHWGMQVECELTDQLEMIYQQIRSAA